MTPSFADKLYSLLAAARAEQGGVLPESKWKAEVQAFADRERPLPKKRKRNFLGKGLTDAEWLTELAKDADLAGVDTVEQARKCRLYFKARGQVPSRARLLRWFSKCDRVFPEMVQVPGVDLSPYKEPESEWRGAAKLVIPQDSVLGERIRDGLDWFDLSLDLRKQILCLL